MSSPMAPDKSLAAEIEAVLLTDAQLRALRLIAGGVTRVSHIRVMRVGRKTLDILAEKGLIETRYPGALYATTAGHTALAEQEKGDA